MFIKEICSSEDPATIKYERIKERTRNHYYVKKAMLTPEDKERQRIKRNQYYYENREHIQELKKARALRAKDA